MKKLFLMLALALSGYCSFAQSPIYTTAGYGANYSTDGAYLGWNISGGGGETNFVNNIGGGNLGGFTFDNTTRSNVTTRLMTILANGNVGIGTTNLSDKLTVAGTLTMGGYGYISIGDAVSNYNTLTSNQDGSLLMGMNLTYQNATSSARNTLITPKSHGALSGAGILIGGNGASINGLTTNDIGFFTNNSGTVTSGSIFAALPSLVIKANGNILIGKTAQPNVSYKLDINGSARANEIVVNTTGADFVFNDKYSLPKLSEVKSYIDQNHHLPEIPSAEQMKKDGLSVGEMNTKLLQKVEELTLYLIQQNKQLQTQQQEIDELKRTLKK